MKQTIAALLLSMGMVASGVAQDYFGGEEFPMQRGGALSIIDTGPNYITVLVTAGSQGTPYGFLVRWSQPGNGHHNVTFDGVSCPEFSLPPFGSTIVTIDGTTGSSCIVNESPAPILCDQRIKCIGRVLGLGSDMNGSADITDPCP